MSEAFDAVDVIIAKRDRARALRRQIDWVIDAYTRGVVAEEQMSRLAMAILLNGMTRREISRWTGAMIRSVSGWTSRGSLGRRPTSTRPAEWATRSPCRWRRSSPACGVAVPQLSGRGLGPHRRHPRQARVDPRLAGRPDNEQMMRQLEDVGAVICAAGRARARRQEALRAARRHRHRRGDPAHRELDHEQEDRRGHRRAGARRQGRLAARS